MHDAPTDNDYLSWREHDEHAGDAAEIDAEYRAEARQEAEQRHATATTSCPTCAAPPGQECNHDTTHPARMHAASLPCGTDCPACPITLRLSPARSDRDDTPGHWVSHHKIRMGDKVYRVGYADHLAVETADLLAATGPYVWSDLGRSRYEPDHLITAAGATLLINGTAYTITTQDGNGRLRLPKASTQPPRPHTLTSTAEEIAAAIDKALDRIDTATSALADLTSSAPEPGTPIATLATMRQRLRAAIDDLRAVHQCAEDLTDPQPRT
ncbi:hypothetical protein [Micromonospora sp. NPDC048063]|uniref:hypothetical protein n=1 Tax=Micromonospora sp. NPDC048063 TaxID=3364256 RepID=UPI003717833D